MHRVEEASANYILQMDETGNAIPGYNQTEVGLTPEGWTSCELGDAVVLQRGFDLPQRLRAEGSVPIISSSGVSGRHNQSMVNAPGLVTGRYGTIGEVFYIEEPFWPLNTTLYVREFNGITPIYAYHLLKTVDFVSHSGKSGVPGVNRNDVHQERILLPPIEEQTAIANALSDVDALIKELEKSIAKKQAIKTATMQQLLTGRTRLPQFALHEDGTPKGYKPSELGDVPEDWDVVPLGKLLAYEQPTKYLVSHSKFLDEGLHPVLTAGKSFVLGYTNEEHGVYMDFPVIIFDDFTTDSKYVDFPFKAKSSAMKMLKPKNAGTPLSLIFNLLTNVDFLVGDHKRHWISEFQHINVAIPSNSEEQAAIAKILSDMDEEIQTLQQRLNKTRQIKQGMMQELLTGKTRLV